MGSQGVVTDLDFEAVKNKVESYKEQICEAREKESSLGKQITELETYIEKFQKWLDEEVEPEIESENAQNPENKLEFYNKMNNLNQNMLTQKPHINQTYERIVELSKSADSYKKTKTVQKLLAEATNLQQRFERNCKLSIEKVNFIEDSFYAEFVKENCYTISGTKFKPESQSYKRHLLPLTS